MDGLGPHGEVKATFMSKLLTEEEEFKIQERDKPYLKSFKFETNLPKLIIENSASEKIYDFSNCWREIFYIDAMAEESVG